MILPLFKMNAKKAYRITCKGILIMLENKDGKCVLGGGVYTYNLRIGEGAN